MKSEKKNRMLYPDNTYGVYLYEYPLINGIPQYVQIRGMDKTNPLMLVLHGGPGGSLAGLCHEIQKGWEEKYTIVNYDQRNSCKTYLKNKDKAGEIAKHGSIDDYVKDIDDLIAYLHTVYEFEKIIILGFSWGSIIGAEYIKRYPEKIEKYIGVGQFINFTDGYKYICDKMLELELSESEKKKVNYLKDAFPDNPIMDKTLLGIINQFGMFASRKLTHSGKVFPIKALFTSPFLTLKEKKTMVIADWTLLKATYETMFAYDFRKDMTFNIPVHFIYGAEDISCPHKLMSDCFENINAVEKKLSIIDNATHMCFYDQPDEFLKIIIEE